MKREEFEKMARGIEIGYRDRYGKQIKVSDQIVIFVPVLEALAEY